jgi:hypothetical protein
MFLGVLGGGGSFLAGMVNNKTLSTFQITEDQSRSCAISTQTPGRLSPTGLQALRGIFHSSVSGSARAARGAAQGCAIAI